MSLQTTASAVSYFFVATYLTAEGYLPQAVGYTLLMAQIPFSFRKTIQGLVQGRGTPDDFTRPETLADTGIRVMLFNSLLLIYLSSTGFPGRQYPGVLTFLFAENIISMLLCQKTIRTFADTHSLFKKSVFGVASPMSLLKTVLFFSEVYLFYFKKDFALAIMLFSLNSGLMDKAHEIGRALQTWMGAGTGEAGDATPTRHDVATGETGDTREEQNEDEGAQFRPRSGTLVH